MYTLAKPEKEVPADVPVFLATVNTLAAHPVAEARTLIDPRADVVIARAPGRLDVMGGIADYSGSLVLQMPIREATLVALQKAADRTLTIVSLGDASDRSMSFQMPLADFEQNGQPISYEQATAYFKKDPARHWAAYVAGVFLVLMRERGVNFSEGARVLVSSQVPEGKGVSSSAAIEVATMRAVTAAFGISIESRELAILCQKVENLIVGAPCGVMDQMASACGQEHRLLALLCQPAELQGLVTISDEIAVWGLDSGVRHSVSGADYGSVRVGAFMGYRIIAEAAGLKVEARGKGEPVRIIDPKWNGYVANVSTDEFESTYKDQLPTSISGAEFLDRFQGTSDTVMRVQPDKTYAVRVPTAHPIYEHARVRKFAELLKSSAPLDERLAQLGKLMVQSHLSYSACGLGSDGTDRLVRLVERAGPAKGLFGAKITGGGSGGTVAVIGRNDAGPAIHEIAALYAKQTGHKPHIFSGSSPGACSFEVRRQP